MRNPAGLKLTAPGDREIVMTRDFNAPRQLVFDCWTKPELVRRWLLGPAGWSMPVCRIDLRVGGAYRFEWRHILNGYEMAMGGIYHEIAPPDRLVCTESFDEKWYTGDALGTMVFTERSGTTTLVQTILYESKQARDMVLISEMEKGVTANFDRLEDLLASGAIATGA